MEKTLQRAKPLERGQIDEAINLLLKGVPPDQEIMIRAE